MNKSSPSLTGKLTISQEASPRALLRRKCDCGSHTPADSECKACAASKSGAGVPPVVHEVLHSPGRPLDNSTRAILEPRFGHDFSGVRVHTDARSAESARVVNALAYTVGRDVVFGAGQYAPETMSGKRLLAHELAHTIQQRAATPSSANALQISNPGTTLEKDADRAADFAVTGGIASVEVGAESVELQRQLYSGPNVGPPVSEVPKPPILSCGPDKKGDWVCKGENVPGVGSTPEIPVDPQKIPDKVRDALDPNASATKGLADCRGFPGFTPGGSTSFRGQCCNGTESKENCCFPDRIGAIPGGVALRCCKEDETVQNRKCVKSSDIPSAIPRPQIQPGSPVGAVPGTVSQGPKPSGGLSTGTLKPSPFFLASVGSLTIDSFDHDKANLTESHKTLVNLKAKTLLLLFSMDPNASVEIVGHTDATGGEKHNLELGRERAAAVWAKLVASGVPPEKLTIRSAGYSELLVKSQAPEPRNRRVEIRFRPSLNLSVGLAPKPSLSPMAPPLSLRGQGSTP